MNKKFIMVFSVFLALSTVSMANNLEPLDFSSTSTQAEQKQNASGYGSSLDTKTKYYPNASLSSAVTKYKKGNYSGCLQELFSYVQKKPGDAVAYYYMGMAFTKIGDSDAAVKSYERVLEVSKDPALTRYAQLGKDNLTGGSDSNTQNAKTTTPTKTAEQTEKEKQEAFDDFVKSPYGNGLSPELDKQLKEEKLKRIQETINKKDQLENKDLERIRKFDIENSSSQAEDSLKIANASPSDKDILNAIKTLKDAGMNVSVQATSAQSEKSDATVQNQQTYNPYTMMTGGYTDPQMAQMSMMLGNNNNNNNNMINMMPFLMQSQQNGQNIDPQVMQAIMMQQMMPSMDFGVNNNNN